MPVDANVPQPQPWGQQPVPAQQFPPVPQQFPGQQLPALPAPGWAGQAARPDQAPPYRRAAAQRNRNVGASLALIIVAASLMALAILFAFGNGPVGFILGLLPCLLALSVAVMCYLWLDRWEPEPVRLLLMAFVWGGGIAVLWALLVDLALHLSGIDLGDLMPVLQAPIVEEIGKGSLLFLMITGLRKRELNSLVDYLIYAGFVGLGFAFSEDLLYFARGADNLFSAELLSVVRLWTGIFAHPLFTSMTAVGLWYGAKKGNRLLYGLLGLLAAMAMHATWNGVLPLIGSLGGNGLAGLLFFYLGYFVIMVPIFMAMVTLALRSRRREGLEVAAQLPRMVGQGLILPQEASWLASLTNREARVRQASILAGGAAAAAAVRTFIDAVTELAFLRARLDSQHRAPSALDLAEHQRLLDQVANERTQALPALAAVEHCPLAPEGPVPAQ